MNNIKHSSIGTLLFFKYSIEASKSLPIIEEWLNNNPQETTSSLYELIKSDKVIVRN